MPPVILPLPHAAHEQGERGVHEKDEDHGEMAVLEVCVGDENQHQRPPEGEGGHRREGGGEEGAGDFECVEPFNEGEECRGHDDESGANRKAEPRNRGVQDKEYLEATCGVRRVAWDV